MKRVDWIFIGIFVAIFAFVRIVAVYYPFYLSYEFTYSLFKAIFHVQ